MKIAFVGKGGVGKSLLAGTVCRHLARRGLLVLALDVDTVPGLAFSLGGPRDEACLPAELAERVPERGWRVVKGAGAARLVDRYAGHAPDGVRFLELGKLPERVEPAVTVAPLVERAEALLDRGELGLPPEQVAALQAEVAALWAVVWNARGDPDRAASYGERAWADLPATAEYALGVVGALVGLAKRRLGDPNTIEALLDSPRGADLEAHPAVTLRLHRALATIHWSSGDLPGAELHAQRTAELARARGLDAIVAWEHYTLGCIHYTRDDLTAARQHFAAVIDLRHKANTNAISSSLRALALIDQAQGASPPAGPCLKNTPAPAPTVWALDAETVRAFDARLALARDDLATASRWLRTARATRPPHNLLLFNTPEPTRIRVLLALGTERAPAEASHRLADEATRHSGRHDVPRLIESLALQALVCQAQGAGADALATLERVLELAAPGGFARTFLEPGPAMARLLLELSRRRRLPEHGRRVRAQFGAHPPPVMQVLPTRESVAAELIEPLTEREREVLALLTGRLSNKEVARALRISWQTVTKHTVNIYQKLQVSDRREAIQRGRALGLLPAPGAAEEPGVPPPGVA